MDQDGRVRSWNAATQRLFGYSADEMIGRPITVLVPADRTHEEDHLLEQVRAGQRVERLETVRLAKDGRRIETSITISPMRDGSGQVVGASEIIRDITQQKHTERTSRDAGAQFRRTFENAAVGIANLDANGNWVSFNERYCQILGYTRDELLKLRIQDLTHADDRDRNLAPFRLMVDGNIDSYTIEKRYVHKNGHAVWVHLTVSAERDDDGRLRYCIGVIQDITDRKKVEEAVRDSEERFRAVLENSLDAAYRRDLRADTYDYLSPVIERVMGIGVARMRTMSVGELLQRVHPDDKHRVVESIQQGMASHHGRVEYRFLGDGGEYRWVADQFTVQVDAGGKPQYRIGIVRDVTQQKKAEEELRQRAASVRLLSETATTLLLEERPGAVIEGIFAKVAAHLGVEVYLNYLTSDDGSHLRLNAYSGIDEQVARSVERLELGAAISGAAAGHRRPVIVGATDDSINIQQETIRLLGVRAYAAFPLLARGKLIGTLSFGARNRDEFAPEEIELLHAACEQVATAIERSRLALELQQRADDLAVAKAAAEQAKAAAEDASRAKDHFLAVLSHELRTPLTPVTASLALLEHDERLPADVRDELSMVQRNVELETRLIDDLLDLTRVARGKITLNKRSVAVCTLLEHVGAICAPDLEARGIELKLNICDRPAMVDADPARLQQIFWNIVKNAAKFTPAGGRIEISMSRQDGFATAEVRDTGRGIHPDLVPHIFNAFEQGGQDVTRQFGGLGLGLAICKMLVDLHGGKISAHSDGVGKGATFRVQLPVVAEALPMNEANRPVPATRELSPRVQGRVLLVEDHADTARIMKRFLSSRGHEVTTAGDLASGLGAARGHRFDVLVSDLGLPDGSGLDLVRELRSSGVSTPAIALSGYGQEEDMQRSRDAGFGEHLVKPVDVRRLQEAVERAIAARSVN